MYEDRKPNPVHRDQAPFRGVRCSANALDPAIYVASLLQKTPVFPEFLRWHHAVMCSFNYNFFLMWYRLFPVDFYLNGSSIANLIFSPQHQLQTKSNRNLTKKYVFYVLLNSVTGKEKVMIPQENVYITFDSVCFLAIWDALVG